MIFLIKYLRRNLYLVEVWAYSSLSTAKLLHIVFPEHVFRYQRLSISQNSFWWLLLKLMNSNICIRYVKVTAFS